MERQITLVANGEVVYNGKGHFIHPNAKRSEDEEFSREVSKHLSNSLEVTFYARDWLHGPTTSAKGKAQAKRMLMQALAEKQRYTCKQKRGK